MPSAKRRRSALPQRVPTTGPAAIYDQRRKALIAAPGAKGVLDRDWEMPFGTLPGGVMAGIASVEHLTHGWDVAKATGQDTSLPADLVMECMGVVTRMDAMLRTPGVCGPAVSVPDDTPLQDRFIAFLGRDPLPALFWLVGWCAPWDSNPEPAD